MKLLFFSPYVRYYVLFVTVYYVVGCLKIYIYIKKK